MYNNTVKYFYSKKIMKKEGREKFETSKRKRSLVILLGTWQKEIKE